VAPVTVLGPLWVGNGLDPRPLSILPAIGLRQAIEEAWQSKMDPAEIRAILHKA
jgi:hypothetical protein